MSRRTASLGLIGTDPVSKGAFALTCPQVTEHMLRAFGVQTCGELYRKRSERGVGLESNLDKWHLNVKQPSLDAAAFFPS